MNRSNNDEVAIAFDEYRKRGVIDHDWESWASLFTLEAKYIEHFLGEFSGREQISQWIVSTMKQYPNISMWMEWWAIDGDRVALYIWNNLPDPTGTGKRYGFPNTTYLRYGNGLWDYEEDFYNPADAERVWQEWFNDGGRIDTPPDNTLRGIEDWAPEVPDVIVSREEVEEEFRKYVRRGEVAVQTGNWSLWADQFTEDARYFEHHYGNSMGGPQSRNGLLQ
ncbi:MAG: hypothetical protein CM15mP49_32370 [Actinomycetota bacterium]|nr:MAG: hypothetical protein CM15mP49_32370 [Actinomycetota bacterium]